MLKKVIFTISLMTLLICLPKQLQAAEYQGTCGKNLTWYYQENTGTLTISGTGDMKQYDSKESWLDGGERPGWAELLCDERKDIQIKVEPGVSSIGDYAFMGARGVTSVSFPDSVKKIGAGSFQFCTKLKTVYFNQGLTNIGRRAFFGCGMLERVTLPDTLKKAGGYTFAYCKNLSELYLGKKMKGIEAGMFYQCRNLTLAALPISAGYVHSEAFYGCNSLKQVYWPREVKSIGNGAFGGGASKSATFYVYSSSKAYRYAKALKINKEIIDRPLNTASITEPMNGMATISFQASGTNGSYSVYQSENGGAYCLLGSTEGTSFLVKDLLSPATYDFQLRTSFTAGGMTYVNQNAGKVSLEMLPEPVQLTLLTNPFDGMVQVSWMPQNRVSGYDIWYSLTSDFSQDVNEVAVSPEMTTETIRMLQAKQIYFIKVRAFYMYGEEKKYGPFGQTGAITLEK